MINGFNSIDSMFSNPGSDPFLNPFSSGLSSLGFASAFNRAMTQATTPQQKAEVLFAQAQFGKLTALSSMFSSPDSSSSGALMGDLFGAGGPLSLPSWVSDAQRLLGGNATVQGAANMVQEANFLAQSQFNHSLASFGLGGSVNSLV